MYNLVCHCVEKLDMQNIDHKSPNHIRETQLSPPNEGADHYRKGFWALLLVDIFFRLLHDKPAIITANVTEWHVNLPSLDVNPELAEHVVPALAFVKSRLNLLLLRFFDLVGQDSEDKCSVINSIEGPRGEIGALFKDCPVGSLVFGILLRMHVYDR
ncbi:hypothetical protein VTK73DRAFT_5549 [Phialemonium thermophilum]|uniref:Transcription factor domain-containing protein n=1 Tax=Phialemonium thermophilum TaxID=223376 RepID=A0ABR3XX02_9PEZI